MKKEWVWQSERWPDVPWDVERVGPPLDRARSRLEVLVASLTGLGFCARLADQVRGTAIEVVRTAEIEGERLDLDSVRSSVARRLGLEVDSMDVTPAPGQAEGLVDVLVDATMNAALPLTRERILGWHASLFPTGWSGMRRITPGSFRPADMTMQVVSGSLGRETVHFVAPPGDSLDSEIDLFLRWFETPPGEMDAFVVAALAHFRFVTIHPFEDGNGRLARAIADMALARGSGYPGRHFSMSAAIMKDRPRYYDELRRASAYDADLTAWIVWFLGCLTSAVDEAGEQVAVALQKARFWQDHGGKTINVRQAKILNRLLDAGSGGFKGGMTTRKAAHLTGAGTATAFRDLVDLVDKGMLIQNPGGGRSTSYRLNI